jgi:O-antigen/teichoic acid export membrane protein
MEQRTPPVSLSAERADDRGSAAGAPPSHLTTGDPAAPGDVLGTPRAGPAAVRGGVLRVGGYLIGVLISAVSAALLFRHLGVVDIGRYVTAMSLVALVGALSDLGLTGVGIRELAASKPSERERIARDLLGLRLVLTVAGGTVMTAIAAAAYSSTLAAGVALASVGLLFQVTQDNFAMALVVDLRLGWVAALELIRQALTTLSILMLVLLGARLLAFLAVSMPVGVVTLACTVAIVRVRGMRRPSFVVRRWRPLVSAVLPYSAAVAASALYFRVSIVLVSALGSATQLGYFSASFRIVEVLTAVPGLLASAAFPIFARAATTDHKRLGYALGRVFDVALIVGAWVAVSVAVGAPLAIKIIGGSAFHPATQVLAVQGVALGVMFVSAVWGYGMLGLGLYRQILLLNLVALMINAAWVTVLVSLDGARGAAIGTAIAEVAVAVGNAALVVRGRPALRPSLRILPRVAIAAVFALTPLAMSAVPVIARLVISTALFAFTLVITRAIPSELRVLVPTAIARRMR